MAEKLQFGILRAGSQRFSDLSPGLQSLFNVDAATAIRKQETEELESAAESELIETLLEEAEKEMEEELTDEEKEDLKVIIEEKIASIIAERNNPNGPN